MKGNFSAADFRRRAEYHIANEPADYAGFGDYRLNPKAVEGLRGMQLRDAAVLIGIVDHPYEATVILTKRNDNLRKHSGQIAFPGGKIDGDETAEVAALREAEEEIGLGRHFVDVIGSLPTIPVLSGFNITPVLGVVRPGFELVPNPEEVEFVFEVPLSFLMHPDNHGRESWILKGVNRQFYVMLYGERRIWGITAGIIRSLYERFYE